MLWKTFAVLFISFLIIPQLAYAQTVLNPGSTSFNTNALIFQYIKLVAGSILGVPNYLDVFWNVYQPGVPVQNIAANCTFTGASVQSCNPQPFIQAPGPGSCTVSNPNYDYADLNNISCFVYTVGNTVINGTYNTSFYPLALTANASLGSLTVGQQATLTIGIQNIGLMTDNYTVNITSPFSYISISNPLSSTGILNGNPVNETARITSAITALASFGSPSRIDIYINSTVNPAIGQEISIQLQAGLASLPDFTIFGIIQIFILAALILLAKK